jgi:hypothetical protein
MTDKVRWDADLQHLVLDIYAVVHGGLCWIHRSLVLVYRDQRFRRVPIRRRRHAHVALGKLLTHRPFSLLHSILIDHPPSSAVPPPVYPCHLGSLLFHLDRHFQELGRIQQRQAHRAFYHLLDLPGGLFPHLRDQSIDPGHPNAGRQMGYRRYRTCIGDARPNLACQAYWLALEQLFGVFFYVAGVVIMIAFSNTICDAVSHYIDGVFIFTLCMLLSVMMVYKYWDCESK